MRSHRVELQQGSRGYCSMRADSQTHHEMRGRVLSECRRSIRAKPQIVAGGAVAQGRVHTGSILRHRYGRFEMAIASSSCVSLCLIEVALQAIPLQGRQNDSPGCHHRLSAFFHQFVKCGRATSGGESSECQSFSHSNETNPEKLISCSEANIVSNGNSPSPLRT